MLGKLSDFLNGKKTIIGAIIDFVVGVISIAQKSFGFVIVPDAQLAQLHDLALFVITVGLAHKAYKNFK